jgi:methionyl-tRNA formyltransferase
MRAVFIGTVEVSWHCLEAILRHDDVLAIFTMPDSKAANISAFRAFDDLAASHGVPLYKVPDINTPDIVALLRSLAPDIVYCVGWPRLVKEPILSLPPRGCVGMHSSLLPKYRGGAPVNWGLIAGERRWGISLMYLGDGPDIGDIIGQLSFDVGPDETCGDVYDKVTEASVRIFDTFVPQLGAGTAPRIVQDATEATHYPKRKPADGVIDWGKTARQLHDWVRALTRPYPGAFTFLADGTRVTIWRARVADESSSGGTPGAILDVQPYGGIIVQCGTGRLLVEYLEPAGSIGMAAGVWAAHLGGALPRAFVNPPPAQGA